MCSQRRWESACVVRGIFTCRQLICIHRQLSWLSHCVDLDHAQHVICRLQCVHYILSRSSTPSLCLFTLYMYVYVNAGSPRRVHLCSSNMRMWKEDATHWGECVCVCEGEMWKKGQRWIDTTHRYRKTNWLTDRLTDRGGRWICVHFHTHSYCMHTLPETWISDSAYWNAKPLCWPRSITFIARAEYQVSVCPLTFELLHSRQILPLNLDMWLNINYDLMTVIPLSFIYYHTLLAVLAMGLFLTKQLTWIHTRHCSRCPETRMQ